jgi:hypothetical protein
MQNYQENELALFIPAFILHITKVNRESCGHY